MSDRSSSFTPNPVLGGLLGLGPLAVAANNLSDGLILGAGTALSSLLLGLLLPPLRRELPERFQAPASLALSTILALLYGLLIDAYLPVSATSLWIYLPLISVNCLSLHAIKASAGQAKRGSEGAGSAFSVAIGSLGYFLVAALLGALRELAGLGTLSLPAFGSVERSLVLAEHAPLRILAQPAGGFILLGFLTALYRGVLRARGRKIL